MDVQDELRQLEERRQVYLSTLQDPSTTRVQREEALGDLELTEAKIPDGSGSWNNHDWKGPRTSGDLSCMPKA